MTIFHKIRRKKISVLNSPENVALDFVEDNLPPMPPLENDEEVKLEPEETSSEREKLNPRKNKKYRELTRNKLLTRIPILITRIKAGKNSNKLKKEYCSFCINTIKSPKKFITV